MKFILSNANLYNLFQNMLGATKTREVFINEYVKPSEIDSILDVGCGTAKILDKLPEFVRYYGVDASQAYIDHAKFTYLNRTATFIHGGLENIPKDVIVNIVLATGLLHHLTDDEVIYFAEMTAGIFTKNNIYNGKLYTIDPCFESSQNLLAKFVISKDRGKYIRHQEDYVKLLSKFYPVVESSLRRDLLFIPYTHVICQCSLY